jgi:hypothetical protein
MFGLTAGFSLCFVASINSVRAQPPEFVPAQFKEAHQLEQIGIGRRDLGRRKDSVSIRCQSFVEVDGSLDHAYCVPPNNIEDQRVTRKIVLALEDVTVNPAHKRGTPVRVLMSFTVSVECDTDPCSVVVATHHGYSRDIYGDDYFAPQPILPGLAWYTGFADKLDWIEGWMPNVSRTFNHELWPLRPRIGVTVAADGSAATGCIEFISAAGDDNEQRNRQKLEQAIRSIAEVRFIPGFHDGEPVSMQFSEYAVFRDAAQKVSARRLFDQGGRIANRLYPRRLADREEAPELYCTE